MRQILHIASLWISDFVLRSTSSDEALSVLESLILRQPPTDTIRIVKTGHVGLRIAETL